MSIVQDPAGTTPEKTQRLCMIHNKENPRDRTAQHAYDLWNAAVTFDIDETENDPYLRNHYWANALFHGVSKKANPDLRKAEIMEAARLKCEHLLLEQIRLLSPQIIIANGSVVAKSMLGIQLISQNGMTLKRNFRNVYIEKKHVTFWKKCFGFLYLSYFCASCECLRFSFIF
jgi:hypothetical protein